MLQKVADLDLPESEEYETHNNLIYSIVNENLQRGVKEQEIRDNLDKISTSAKEAARNQLKLRYLLQRIAVEEGVTVANAEVENVLMRYALRARKTVKEFIRTEKLNETKLRRDIRNNLRNEKVLYAVLGHAQLTGPGAMAAAPKPEETP